LTTEEKQETSYGTVDIESQVDHYGELKSKLKSLNSELDQIKEEIEKYFAEKKLRKVKGKRYQLFCEFKDKWNFSKREEELYQILKEHGLWERALAPTHAGIVKLLHAPDLDQQTREQLKNLAEKEQFSTIRVQPLEK